MMGVPLSQIGYFLHLTATVVGVIAIFWLTRYGPSSRWTTGLLTAGCTALAVTSFVLSNPPYIFWDFREGYYPAGLAVLNSPAMLRPLTNLGVVGFASMPIVAYLFAPLSLLPSPYATALFTLIGLSATVVAWMLLARLAKLGLTGRWLLALIFVASGPLPYSLKEGNMSHLILLALVVGLALLRSDRSAAAGALLGCAAVIKPPLLLFGLFFALRRDLRGTLSFAGIFGAAAALSIAVFGWDDNRNWFEVCIVQYSHRWLAAFNDQSIPSLLFRLHAGPELMSDWTSFPPPSAGALLTAQVLSGLLYLVAIACCIGSSMRTRSGGNAQDDLRRDLQYLLVPCLTIVSSPLAWSHYYTWLLMPTAFFLGSRSPFPRTPIVRCLGWVAIFLTLPLVRPLVFSDTNLMSAYWEFGVSHFLFGGLAWFGLLSWSLAQSGGLLSPSNVAMQVRGQAGEFRTGFTKPHDQTGAANPNDASGARV